MKKQLSSVIIAIAIIFSFSSCALHSGLTGNLNNHVTNVVLQDNNYKIIKKVTGTATGTRVLCLFGGYQRPLMEKARSQMLESADLIGKPRAIINETIEVNNKFFLVVGFKTVTVSAYVIEFTGTGIIETTTTKKSIEENSNVTTEKIIDEKHKENMSIIGKWISEKEGLEITINNDVGVISQIKSGKWLRLLNKGKIRIGDIKLKDISKAGQMTWTCKDLQHYDFSFDWYASYLTLNEAGDKLTVGTNYANYGTTYILSRVEE